MHNMQQQPPPAVLAIPALPQHKVQRLAADVQQLNQHYKQLQQDMQTMQQSM